MKKILISLSVFFLISGAAFPQFTFYLIDNFEDGNFTEGPKWWRFGDLTAEVTKNSAPETRDLIAESCGDYSHNLAGQTNDWYMGGVGTDIVVDASRFSRFQLDISGNHDYHGKLIIEFFDDDNKNYSIEQDPQKNYKPINDDKWTAEVIIQGKGFTRTSIPFSAFRDANPGIGDGVWNPDQKDGSGGLLKMQVVAITEKQDGKLDFKVDNLLLTY